ncbi:MAG: helix-turn-helix transcriptional regulator [Bacteroidales bacterium]
MATNKHATIRYHALDQCFSNTGRRYFIEDLVEACNNALYEYTGIIDGIKRRQVFEDIKFMESEQGWSVPLERIKDGKRVYYKYEEKSFSIKNQGINETEVKQLKETLSILCRFKGMPQFEWMEEMLLRIESTFNLKGNNNAIVGFEQNPYLKGLDYITELFNAIQYKKVINIQYQSFKQLHSVEIILHPYYLKQYNSRWFLFGYNEEVNSISNLALDRMNAINETTLHYIENKTIDFEDYFEDVIGATVKNDTEPTTIILEINKNLWPYIETKPIHGSQKIKSREEESVVIELSLQINYELAALIFSLGEDIKVIAPIELKDIIKNKAEALLKRYL